jgi:thiol:disulfide interchange protein DsbC
MRAFALATLLACCLPARADFVQDLHVRFPQTKNAVVKKAFANFYSVIQGSDVVFINEDFSILINGEVVDLKGNRSLTSTLREQNRPKFKLSDLREADAIRMSSGSRRIFVFSDPDCPFCRQLQAEVGKLRDVSVFIVPFPLAALHPNAARVAESIWCAADPGAAWDGYVLRGVKPDAKSCPNPLERNVALAARYQVMGTPAIVFADGSVIPGAVPAAVIEERLAALAKQ